MQTPVASPSPASPDHILVKSIRTGGKLGNFFSTPGEPLDAFRIRTRLSLLAMGLTIQAEHPELTPETWYADTPIGRKSSWLQIALWMLRLLDLAARLLPKHAIPDIDDEEPAAPVDHRRYPTEIRVDNITGWVNPDLAPVFTAEDGETWQHLVKRAKDAVEAAGFMVMWESSDDVWVIGFPADGDCS